MHVRNCKGKKMYLIKENDVKIEYLIGFICHSENYHVQAGYEFRIRSIKIFIPKNINLTK